jgi:uncharacterized protein (DUF924 family)
MEASVEAEEEAEAELIEAVREYWFGGDQRTNYRLKWFPDIASGLQSKVDSHIVSSFDKLLEDGIAEKLNHWQRTQSGCVALIVLLDQFSRHIHRYKGALLPAVVLQQERADALALSVAQAFHANSSFHAVGLSTAEFVFSLMPFRHTATIDRLNMVLRRLGDKDSYEEHSNELMSRFRKQTIRRLQHLQDRAKVRAPPCSPPRCRMFPSTNILPLVFLTLVLPTLCTLPSWRRLRASWSTRPSPPTRATSCATHWCAPLKPSCANT